MGFLDRFPILSFQITVKDIESLFHIEVYMNIDRSAIFCPLLRIVLYVDDIIGGHIN